MGKSASGDLRAIAHRYLAQGVQRDVYQIADRVDNLERENAQLREYILTDADGKPVFNEAGRICGFVDDAGNIGHVRSFAPSPAAVKAVSEEAILRARISELGRDVEIQRESKEYAQRCCAAAEARAERAEARLAEKNKALEWYGEQAEAIARYTTSEPANTTAITAVVQTMALDAGRRARETWGGEDV